MIRTCVFSLISLFTLPCVADDSPQFRGPGSQGAFTASNLPASWSNTKNLVWRKKLPGYGASSPIALGDRFYLTCYSGYGLDKRDPGNMDNLRLHVVALDQQSGGIVWNETIEPTLPESPRVRDHGYAAATPATDGESLFVYFGKSGVMKFDLDGNQQWRTHVGSGTHQWGCGTSPVLFENLVIVNASVESGELVALNKATGKEVWRSPGMARSWNTPHLVQLASGKSELVVNVKGSVLGFDPASGKQLWTCQGIPDYICPSIVSQDGIVYAIGGRQSRAIAVRAGGRGDVTDSHRLWEAEVGANVSSPVVHEGHLYWVSDRKKVAYCLNLDNGDVVYQQRFPAQPYASTIVADGKLYVVTRFDGTFVLAAKPEFEQLGHNEFDDDSTFNASPIVAGGRLIIRSDQYLYCIGKS